MEHVFIFNNSGIEPLILSNVQTTCGCTATDWPRDPIAPGSTGEIKVVFNSAGKMGRQNKVVTVISNAVNSQEKVKLSLQGRLFLFEFTAPSMPQVKRPEKFNQVFIKKDLTKRIMILSVLCLYGFMHWLLQNYCRLLHIDGRYPRIACIPVHVLFLCYWHMTLRKACKLLHRYSLHAGLALSQKIQNLMRCGTFSRSPCINEACEAGLLSAHFPNMHRNSGYTHRHILPEYEAIPCFLCCDS